MPRSMLPALSLLAALLAALLWAPACDPGAADDDDTTDPGDDDITDPGDDDTTDPGDDDTTDPGDDDTTDDPGDPLWGYPNEAIVFSSYHGGGSLFELVRDGPPIPVELPTAASVDVGMSPPALSPDGTRVLFQADAGPAGAGIYLLDLVTGDESFVTTGGHPDWSPDGAVVVFCRDDGTLSVVAPDGVDPRALLDGGQPLAGCDPEWSPDGSRLAYKHDGDIHVVDLVCAGHDCEASDRRTLTDNGAVGLPAFQSSHDPSWSPDGGELVFMTYTGEVAPGFDDEDVYDDDLEERMRWHVERTAAEGGPVEALTDPDESLVASWLPVYQRPHHEGQPSPHIAYLRTAIWLVPGEQPDDPLLACASTEIWHLGGPQLGTAAPLVPTGLEATTPLDDRLDCGAISPDLLLDHGPSLSTFDW